MHPARFPFLRSALRLAAIGLLLPHFANGTTADPAPVALLTGEIEGAPYTIARPAEWNNNLLLYAHGFKAESAPLSAKLDPQDPTYARLLAEGWIVATTGYRRNGMIVRDAIADLNALRDHIAATEGPPSLTLLVGSSMGGAIVTLIAENEPGRYQGAVALGAAMHARDDFYPLALTARLKIPVIFLTNRSELEGPAAYVDRAARAPVPPALWTIEREGHVNIHADERTAAIEALITWITTNTIERRRDATLAPSQPPPAEVTFVDGTARGRVAEITAGHGNLFSSFVPADFEKLGLMRGDRFDLLINGRTFRVTFGTDYGDAARGSWVAFPRAEGLVLFAINRGNAAQAAGVSPGDEMIVRPVAKP